MLPLGEDADQIVKAVPARAEVACSACGVTRIFVPRFENSRAPGICTPLGRHDLRELEAGGWCKHCGVTGPHDLAVGSNHLTTRCRSCGYTHFYRFNLEYGKMPARRRGGEEVSAPRGP